jgi:hypothetical protein
MIGRYAHVVDGLVVNMSLWDGESDWTPADGEQIVLNDAGAEIGWSYVDGEFVAPEVEEG